MFQRLLALIFLALLPIGLGGCLFDEPLTSPTALTSPNIDTRFLGVFEFRSAPKPKRGDPAPKPEAKPGDNDEIQRVAVLPLGPNKYVIYHRDFSKKSSKTTKFIGWISRVDSSYYLSFQDVTDGSPTFGKYGFFRYDWEFPGNFLLYAPDMSGSEHENSFGMRRALRAKLKAGTAFPFAATYWKKIARVWWDPAGAEAGTTIPPEFETGTTRENPGL
jgi:hypothetical protein